MADRSYRWLLWTLVLVGAGLDQASKYGVFKWLYHDGSGGQHIIVPNVFKLLAQFGDQREVPEHTLAPLRTWSGAMLPKVNHGALFGLGGQYESYANNIFAGVSVAAALAIIFWSTRPSTARDRSLCAALGLILAGTLGNLYDRLIFDGVRDFLYFHWFEWPVFNVADCCLVCGAGLLLLHAFWSQPVRENSESKQVALTAS